MGSFQEPKRGERSHSGSDPKANAARLAGAVGRGPRRSPVALPTGDSASASNSCADSDRGTDGSTNGHRRCVDRHVDTDQCPGADCDGQRSSHRNQ
jgi:hypothetical protein